MPFCRWCHYSSRQGVPDIRLKSSGGGGRRRRRRLAAPPPHRYLRPSGASTFKPMPSATTSGIHSSAYTVYGQVELSVARPGQTSAGRCGTVGGTAVWERWQQQVLQPTDGCSPRALN